MPASSTKVALLYDDSAYVETLKRQENAPAQGPVGLMGRQVAGKEFLDAYLTHGTPDELIALVRNQASVNSLVNLCQTHPSGRTRKRSLRLIDERQFHQSFFPTPPATVIYNPCPPDGKYAWARQHGGPGTFALTGVTHTLSSAAVAETMCNLVTSPFEPYDSLICTSRAVLSVVKAVTGIYADYLRDRHGGTPACRVRLEVIPLGVDPAKYRPATPPERAAQRAAMKISDDEVVVLFVGRLSFHAKAHPFPMFEGVARAARETGQKVHLVLSGWAANDFILNAHGEGARTFAPNVRLTMVDGTNAEMRYKVWRAADVFTSLSDNIQETFGLVIIEAMACGLPVVATDWNGYRDLVVHGETGYLVPTYLLRDATADTTSRLLMAEINYDYFLGDCSQATVVDVAETAAAYARLIRDAALRGQMGEAGRQRVLDHFTWAKVVKAYEDLWDSQEIERQTHVTQATNPRRTFAGPALYPAPEDAYAGYPTALLADQDRLAAEPGSEANLEKLLSLKLTNYTPRGQAQKADVLRAVLAAAKEPCPVAPLDQVFEQAGVDYRAGRASLAWMLKYGLLRVDQPKEQEPETHGETL